MIIVALIADHTDYDEWYSYRVQAVGYNSHGYWSAKFQTEVCFLCWTSAVLFSRLLNDASYNKSVWRSE